MRCLIVFLLLFSASSGWAAGATVRDGDTIQLAGVTYTLDGIDAPEFDQICIDDHAEPWTCGVEARDQLANLIGKRGVRCEDLGPDKAYNKWHIGICTVDGKTVSLNQLMVRKGFALNSESAGKARFSEDEAGAKGDLKGIWKGCFVAPRDFRHLKKTAALLGAACRSDKDREIRASLFPDDR
jgi:endonuclease YncB( thermonuclease family)